MRYLSGHESHPVTFILNGREVTAQVEPRWLLSDVLRHGLGYTGTHVGCEHGVCGACTVLVDGCATRACLVYGVQVQGRRVDTVEGLNPSDGGLNSLQGAFRRHHGLQCGFCTPGILMSLTQLLREEPEADEARVRDVLSGHLCRCTGYHGIVAAALDALAQGRGTRVEQRDGD
ncbi:MAG: (2Fe-2S)-binding protein [Candidatus Competibacterales bacterium]